MESNTDMFQSQSQDGNNFSSCPASLTFSYGYVILFNWDEREEMPFKMFARDFFTKEDIQDSCMKVKLANKYRIKSLKSLSPFPDERMSLFAKVESGMCCKKYLILFDI